MVGRAPSHEAELRGRRLLARGRGGMATQSRGHATRPDSQRLDAGAGGRGRRGGGRGRGGGLLAVLRGRAARLLVVEVQPVGHVMSDVQLRVGDDHGPEHRGLDRARVGGRRGGGRRLDDQVHPALLGDAVGHPLDLAVGRGEDLGLLAGEVHLGLLLAGLHPDLQLVEPLLDLLLVHAPGGELLELLDLGRALLLELHQLVGAGHGVGLDPLHADLELVVVLEDLLQVDRADDGRRGGRGGLGLGGGGGGVAGGLADGTVAGLLAHRGDDQTGHAHQAQAERQGRTRRVPHRIHSFGSPPRRCRAVGRPRRSGARGKSCWGASEITRPVRRRAREAAGRPGRRSPTRARRHSARDRMGGQAEVPGSAAPSSRRPCFAGEEVDLFRIEKRRPPPARGGPRRGDAHGGTSDQEPQFPP